MKDGALATKSKKYGRTGIFRRMNLRGRLFFRTPSHCTPDYFGIDAAGLATWLAVNNYANRHKYNQRFHLLSNLTTED